MEDRALSFPKKMGGLKMIFKISGDQFLYDGKPIRIISGAIHYFRVVPQYWRDRLLKLKACGFNTVETYVAWNVHEPKPDQFNFQGMADLEKFIQTAAQVGLYVIVRPGPYICAEWEFGGLPSWLLADPQMQLRSSWEPYLARVDKFFDALLPRLKPLLCTNGGPIIALQVENEYGSYGNDRKYLEYIKEGLIARGMDVLLFTSDGPTDEMLQGGTLPDIFKTVNFGTRPQEAFAKLKEYQPKKPLMCMEYWNGWFDHWGEEHRTRDGDDVAAILDQMLKLGASVNFYMFHGGTNFGFFSGANYQDELQPTVTSYDYDAPLSEEGELTDKYFKVRDVLAKYVEVDETLLPAPIPKKAYGKVELTSQASLFASLDKLSKPISSTSPVPMESLGQDYGFILYRTQVTGPRQDNALSIQDVHDRAWVFLDGELQGIVSRDQPQTIKLDITPAGAQLDILVENMGRINYGPYMLDRKGITQGVRLGNQFLFDWTIYPLPLNNLAALKWGQSACTTPAFFQGKFKIDKREDTFLSLPGWKKGVVFINGFNLGRYWEIGPTKTLYVPAPILRSGDNELVIFELEGLKKPVVEFLDQPILG
jgi:beta-galactosidase